MTANLTKRTVEAFKYSPDCDYFVWDAKLKGFGVRVREHADAESVTHRRKVFVVGYRPHGGRQYRRLVLGTFGPMTVEQARGDALRYLSAVSSGGDPLASKRAARAEQTVRDLGEAYLKAIRARRKLTTAYEYERLWKKHVLPVLGGKKVVAVTPVDVRRIHRGLHDTPYLGNRVVAMLSAFYSFAIKEGIQPTRTNPVIGIERYAENARERFLTEKEFGRLGKALALAETTGLPPAPQHVQREKEPKRRKGEAERAHNQVPANPYAVAAIRLLSLTGCRKNEVLSLKWAEVDFERGHLRLENTKTGPSIRPLAQSAATILRGLPRIEGNPHVFPGPRPGTHLTEIKRVWFAVRYAAKLDGLRLHDLRHSYASVSATSGDSLLVVRSLLGHQRVATTERYAHLGDDPVKRAANRAASEIAGWLDGLPTQAADG